MVTGYQIFVCEYCIGSLEDIRAASEPGWLDEAWVYRFTRKFTTFQGRFYQLYHQAEAYKI